MIADFYGQGRERYACLEFYKEVPNASSWRNCPKCHLKPVIWEYDNGRHTACGCGKNEYDHFDVQAESINSVVSKSHNGASTMEYNPEELMNNWNHWCETGEKLFEPSLPIW